MAEESLNASSSTLIFVETEQILHKEGRSDLIVFQVLKALYRYFWSSCTGWLKSN